MGGGEGRGGLLPSDSFDQCPGHRWLGVGMVGRERTVILWFVVVTGRVVRGGGGTEGRCSGCCGERHGDWARSAGLRRVLLIHDMLSCARLLGHREESKQHIITRCGRYLVHSVTSTLNIGHFSSKNNNVVLSHSALGIKTSE